MNLAYTWTQSKNLSCQIISMKNNNKKPSTNHSSPPKKNPTILEEKPATHPKWPSESTYIQKTLNHLLLTFNASSQLWYNKWLADLLESMKNIIDIKTESLFWLTLGHVLLFHHIWQSARFGFQSGYLQQMYIVSIILLIFHNKGICKQHTKPVPEQFYFSFYL